MTRILGVDPGLRHTGWGVIETEGSRLSYIDCGTIHTDSARSLAERLVEIEAGLTDIMARFQPEEAAVEETFVNKDARATLKLGQARGIALLVPARAGLKVSEYPPNLVKKTIVGAGHAQKQQIHLMIRILLPKARPTSADAADALAIALTHAQHRTSLSVRA